MMPSIKPFLLQFAKEPQNFGDSRTDEQLN